MTELYNGTKVSGRRYDLLRDIVQIVVNNGCFPMADDGASALEVNEARSMSEIHQRLLKEQSK